MITGKFVFSQLTDFVNKYEFNKCVKRYFVDYRSHELNSWNHFLQLLFGQMTGLNSITGICLCLKAHKKNLYHLGIKQFVNVSTLSRAGESRDWHIFADFGNYLINIVRPLYAKTSIPNLDIDNEILALDSTSISIYLMDKAYVDFETLYHMQTIGALFVTRAKDTMRYEVVEQNYNMDETCGLRSDKTVVLSIAKSKKLYPEKWIKQNPTIKKFWGHSQNAVSIQLWVAIIAYLLVAYLKHALKCGLSVYGIMQILSVSAFDRTPIRELLTDFKSNQNVKELQYSLFDNY